MHITASRLPSPFLLANLALVLSKPFRQPALGVSMATVAWATPSPTACTHLGIVSRALLQFISAFQAFLHALEGPRMFPPRERVREIQQGSKGQPPNPASCITQRWPARCFQDGKKAGRKGCSPPQLCPPCPPTSETYCLWARPYPYPAIFVQCATPFRLAGTGWPPLTCTQGHLMLLLQVPPQDTPVTRCHYGSCIYLNYRSVPQMLVARFQQPVHAESHGAPAWHLLQPTISFSAFVSTCGALLALSSSRPSGAFCKTLDHLLPYYWMPLWEGCPGQNDFSVHR